MLEREAFAQGAELDYQAPAGCPDQAEFRARVERTLQRPLDAVGPLARFQITIGPVLQGYELAVTSEVRGERGTRVLAGPDCNSVADAGALSIAMALSSATTEPSSTTEPSATEPSATEPERRAAARGDPPVRDVPSAPASSAVAVAPAVPSAEQTPDRVALAEPPAPPQNTLALQLLGDYGALPRMSPGVRLSLGRAGRRWSGRVGAEALLPATRWVDGESGTAGGRFWLGAGRVEGCWRATESARASLDACAVFEAGALSGSGVGVDVSKPATLVWLAPGARLVGALPLTTSRAHALVGIEGLVPLLNKRFTVERGTTELYHPARVVARMDLGVAWLF